MQRYDFMSNHVSFSNRFWVSILDNPHRVYRLRRDIVKIKVVDDSISDNYYIVKCGEIYGKVNKYYKYNLKLNQEVLAKIFRIYFDSVSFNIN
jgi:hypothetical protein